MPPDTDKADKQGRDGAERATTERPERESRDTTGEPRSSSRNPQSRAESAYSREFAAAIGRTIKVIRTDLGMERRDLAATVGISYSYLTEIENGNKPASSTVLRPLAHALGLRLSQLTEAAEQRLDTRDDQLLLSMASPMVDAMYDKPPSSRSYAVPSSPSVLGSPQQSALRPSLRGQFRELRDTILELEHLLERMAPDDIERLLDYARRLAR